MEIFNSVLVQLAVGIIAVLLGIVILVRGYSFLKHSEQNYPNEQEIEALILPIVYKAIFSAYKTSEWALSEFGAQLEGIDKKAVADSLYSALPGVIIWQGITIPVKQIINQKQFSNLVQSTFDEFMQFYQYNEQQFIELVDLWLEENK